ncbi:hypothetical protein BpHYR1_018632 [Brachionus plicatilis]|uniref:Uncharacterized protein n=1 Tax=Brachionus plicatilis TaxID=10195 RepID=A0A3M7RVF4_BRAPC|nr:hypothetical protein BpHYR1_018632 [Brachionus plicatilis]
MGIKFVAKHKENKTQADHTTKMAMTEQFDLKLYKPNLDLADPFETVVHFVHLNYYLTRNHELT